MLELIQDNTSLELRSRDDSVCARRGNHAKPLSAAVRSIDPYAPRVKVLDYRLRRGAVLPCEGDFRTPADSCPEHLA
jgi:hypothetical protein